MTDGAEQYTHLSKHLTEHDFVRHAKGNMAVVRPDTASPAACPPVAARRIRRVALPSGGTYVAGLLFLGSFSSEGCDAPVCEPVWQLKRPPENGTPGKTFATVP
jgi:hypothetical protein